MNILQDIALAVGLLQTILASLQQKGAPAEVVASVEAAIQKLLETEGTDVTFEQLEGLRSKATW